MLGVKKMWSFEIEHKVTGEGNLIMGYSFKDACERNELNPDEYHLVARYYED